MLRLRQVERKETSKEVNQHGKFGDTPRLSGHGFSLKVIHLLGVVKKEGEFNLKHIFVPV